MIHAGNRKVVNVINPAAIVNNASPTSIVIDTAGAEYCSIFVLLGAIDIALTALKVQQSDASGSGFVDIAGADFSVSPATLPSATDDNHFFGVEIDLRGKKRYLSLVLTIGNGSTGGFATAWAELSRLKESPKNAAGQGLTQVLIL